MISKTMVMNLKKVMTCLFLVIFSLVFLGGCTDQGLGGKHEGEETGNQTEKNVELNFDKATINSLLAYNDTYLGDSLVIKEILKEHLPGNIYLQTFDITLDRLTINYAPAKDFDITGEAALAEAVAAAEDDFADFWTDDNTKEIILYNATGLFALIKNLEAIEFNVEGYDFPTCIITKAQLDDFYGVDLKTLDTPEKWVNTIVSGKLNSGKSVDSFFEQIPLSTKGNN